MFLLKQVTNKRSNHKVPIVAAASLNIADFASEAREKEQIEIVVPLEAYSGGGIKSNLSLCVSKTNLFDLFYSLVYTNSPLFSLIFG